MKKILIILSILTSQFVFSQDLNIKDFYKDKDSKVIESITFYTRPDLETSDRIDKSESILSLTKIGDVGEQRYHYTDSSFYLNGNVVPYKLEIVIDVYIDRYKVSVFDLDMNETMDYFHVRDGETVSKSESLDGLVGLKISVINRIMSINRSVGGRLYKK